MRRRRTGLAAATLVGVVGVVGAGCSEPTVCPAIGYGTVLEVRLFDGWPGRDDHVVEVRCPGDDPGCGLGEDEDPAGPVWRATVGAPARVDVRVVDTATGDVVSERAAEPRYHVVEHPHGRACGGPREAVVSLVDR